MVSRHEQELKLLNEILQALNEYIAAAGSDMKIISNRKGRRDDVKAIAGYVYACAGLANPLDEMETASCILPFIQQGASLVGSEHAANQYYRMLIGINGVLSRLRTSLGRSSLRNKVTPMLAKWELRLQSRDLAYQGMLVPADVRLGLNTSDHVYQSIKVTFLTRSQRERLSLSGSTMNLLNKCVSKADNPRGYKNNPWNYTETPENYLKRKERQFAKLIEIMTSGEKDFMFLQEVDCLTTPSFLQDPADKAAYEKLKQNFIQYLNKLGWGMVSNASIAQGKPFVTLYNTNTLTPTRRMRMVLDGAGFECEFTHRATWEKVTLVNLHLDYSKDYSETIPAYQQEQANAGRLTVMGGDCNHAPNHRIVGLINNWDNCTNLGGDDEGELTDEHESLPKTKKTYDCFLVNTDQKSTALIEEQPSEVFVPDPQYGFITRPLVPADEYGDHYQHQCPPGAGWQRGGWKEFVKQGGWAGYQPGAKSKLANSRENLGLFDQEAVPLREGVAANEIALQPQARVEV